VAGFLAAQILSRVINFNFSFEGLLSPVSTFHSFLSREQPFFAMVTAIFLWSTHTQKSHEGPTRVHDCSLLWGVLLQGLKIVVALQSAKCKWQSSSQSLEAAQNFIHQQG